MAWRLYRNTDAKREVYDLVIASTPYYPVYLLSWYMDIVCKDWEFLLDEESLSVIPLPVKKKWGFRYAIQPLWLQQMGVFGKEEFLNRLSFADTPLEGIKFLFFRVRSGQFLSETVKLHRNAVLDLSIEVETIRSGYHKQIFRHLKKAEKYGLMVFQGGSAERLFDLFYTNKAPSLRVDHAALRFQFLSIVTTALSKGMGELWRVESKQGDLLASAFFLCGPNRLILLLSGSTEQGKSSGAMSLILDAVIQKYSGMKMLLDFEGSDQDGLFRYYMGFGAKQETYSSVFFSSLPGHFHAFLLERLKRRV